MSGRLLTYLASFICIHCPACVDFLAFPLEPGSYMEKDLGLRLRLSFSSRLAQMQTQMPYGTIPKYHDPT
jgi:hypothetical protein